MKKILVLLTILTLMTGLAGCGGKNTGQLSNGADNQKQSEQENKTSSITGDSGGSGDDEEIEVSEFLYGKVTKITGNEIELAIAKMPEYDTPSGEDGGGDAGDAPAAAMPAAPAEEGTPDDVVGESVEYTGESLTLTIPTGVKFDSMGQESTMSALKKGSIVFITVDNLEDKNISAVSILS